MLKNTEKNYGIIARLLHWTVSIMIIILIIVGLTLANSGPFDQKLEMIKMHKATGVLVLFLVTIRLIWRLLNSRVLLPDDLPGWQKLAAHITHMALYLLIFIMPLSGIIMSISGGHDVNFYGLFTIPSIEQNKQISNIFWNIHGYTAFTLIALILLHISAGLYHHFIRKDNVLMKMIKGGDV